MFDGNIFSLLVNVYSLQWKDWPIFNGKIHYFDWVIFNSYVTNYQRVMIIYLVGGLEPWNSYVNL